jgi:two-component system, cell cycle response regulator
MSATTRSLLRRPRPVEASWPTGLTLLAAALYVAGWVANPASSIWINAAAAAVLVGVCAFLGVRAWRAGQIDRATSFQIERAALVATTAFVVVRTATAFGLELYPLIYLLLAFFVAFEGRTAALAAVAAALVLEWGSHWLGTPAGAAHISTALALEQTVDWTILVTRTAFIGLFGFLSYFVHGTEVLERRRRHRQEVDEQREQMLRQAREFRLLNSGRLESAAADRSQAEQMATCDAVEAVQHTTYVSLSLLKTALDCHTCVLLWFDVRGEKLHIKELVSESDAVIEGGIKPEKGVIGGISRRRQPVKLDDLRSGFRGLSYYRNPQPVRHFVGVPVIEDGHLRGVLCADRTDGAAFTSSDIAVVEDAAAYILRGIENERMFTSIEKTKFELGRFFEASRRLNGVLTPSDVHGVALECIASIVEYDFAAITVFDDEEAAHEIVAVDHAGVFAADVDDWIGSRFEVNQGLVSMVVKNRHYLPYGGQVREATPVVFTDQERLEDVESMLVLPLIAHDEPIGTMVICHRQPGQFSAERREMLEVVGNQVAISLQNARLYARMEQMATTDGLTGLANHRSFQSKLEETIARHRRTEEPFAVILTDIDHFKAVNDTHGHPVGDEVLRQVSRVFEDSLREVDTPCRYGGEEFAIILEDTDRATALLIADRVRTGVAALEFQSDKGAFQCTISMGVAIWPHDETQKQPLIDLTDQALYYSKEHGRDQVTSADQL